MTELAQIQSMKQSLCRHRNESQAGEVKSSTHQEDIFFYEKELTLSDGGNFLLLDSGAEDRRKSLRNQTHFQTDGTFKSSKSGKYVTYAHIRQD